MAERAAQLAELFRDVDLPEITGVDFGKMSHLEIANLLPPYGGKHPMKAILIDRQTGKAYGIASGWEEETVMHNGMPFKAGAVSQEAASQAGNSWTVLGNHAEPVAAAFMRKMGIRDVIVYINARNPCWGIPDGTGCFYRLAICLEEGSTMTVYNKDGHDFVSSRPDRKFHFTGLAD
jgi:hypothetical protein